MDTIFLTVSAAGASIDEDSQTDEASPEEKPLDVARFLTMANASRIAVHMMVLEDPVFALPEYHTDAVNRLNRVLAWCAAQQRAGRPVAGLHLDTEPHGLPGWAGWSWRERERVMSGYLQLLGKARLAIDTHNRSTNATLRLSVATAWWWNEQAAEGNLPSADASKVARHTHFIVPMVYGDEPRPGTDLSFLVARSADEVRKAATLVGIAAWDFRGKAGLDAIRRQLDAHQWPVARNYLGTSVYSFESLQIADDQETGGV